MVTACTLWFVDWSLLEVYPLTLVAAAGGARGRLLPRLVGTILNREAIQNLGCTGMEVVPNFPVAAPPWWRLAPFVGAAGGTR